MPADRREFELLRPDVSKKLEVVELVHTCKACGEAVTGGRDVKREQLTSDWTSAA